MLKLLVQLLAVSLTVSLQSHASKWDQQLAANALECSSNRANAYLDVIVVYDRTIQPEKFEDLSTLLKKELLPLTLHSDPSKSSRVALIGFDSKASIDLDIATVISTEQLSQKLDELPSKRTNPTDKVVLTDALRLALKMVKSGVSTRDLLVILAVSAQRVDSDTGAHGTAMELQRKGAHILTLNYDDENLLLEAYLAALADKGKAFSPYLEPYFAESFTKTINYANCRCESGEFEDGQPIQQFAVYNYTSNHVDYFATCLGAALERKGTGIREWCSSFDAQPLPTPSSLTIKGSGVPKSQKKLVNLYHFVESFVILNNYELNTYNEWVVAESKSFGHNNHKSRNAKRIALLNQQSELALSRQSSWDYISLSVVNKDSSDDSPYICQKRACDAGKSCQGARLTFNYYDLIKK